ncbi:uncharacterized protein [Periplaneta americana]|uniref:uncharacterized protein isoform X3 n=1 Tax=Periplaneta americana TaxID=6978 RepID=UPI0037E857CF
MKMIKTHSTVDPLAWKNGDTVVIDNMKAEPISDPLSIKNENTNGEHWKPLSSGMNFFEVNINEIKTEPSCFGYNLTSDIKHEENDIVKIKAEEESWNADDVKQEIKSDEAEDDDSSETSRS